jgi:predicted O-linked N-acetylglucosamine transferase (SPINDLY family)/SAM-dependent methyltransferase
MAEVQGARDYRRSEADGTSGRPSHATLLTAALEFSRSGRFDAAGKIYEEILADVPDQPVCLHHLGLIAHRQGDNETAARLIGRAVSVKPGYVEALSNLGAIYRAMGRPDDALAAVQSAIAADPNCVQAYSNLGGALEDLGRLDAALAAYEEAARRNPGFLEASVNAANLLRKLGRREEALATCEAIIAQRPDAAEPFFSLGNIARELGRPDAALEAFRHAIALRPSFAEAMINLGNVLQGGGAFAEAAEAYRQAIGLRPDLAAAHVNLGSALENLGQLAEAIAAYRAAVALDPTLVAVRAWLHHQRRSICDWTGIDAEEAELLSVMAIDPADTHPFAVLDMATSPAEQLRISRAYAAQFRPSAPPFRHEPPQGTAGRRLRIGYLSADFCRHATALLTVELFEQHDKARFEIFAYSLGSDDYSALSARLREAFDHFVELRDRTDDEAARRIHADGIDILVDLKGYTKDARTGITARRPAPVQVSFLGFPATLGADFIDYVIADPFVLPMDQTSCFDEKIVHLPHCYQPNDRKRIISDLTPTRAECGLPEQGFVFCSFNNSYKFTPAFFDVWMRLLTAVPGSVLWLLESNPFMTGNLRREASDRGVDPSRLVFAPRCSPPDHLARHRLADLFLDTLPYGAHTTASDALWAGLPVLTCMGTTFAGRVAGSLLHAVGLPQLVTSSLKDYEALALRLAREPGPLVDLRRALAANRLGTPLFDCAAYTRHFEAALAGMWETWVQGEAPRAFAVVDEPRGTAPAPQRARIPYLACPLCEGTDIPATIGADCSKHALYQSSLPPVVTWHQCRDCGHVFTEGIFDDASAAVVLSRIHPGQAVGHDMERQRPISARMIERVARYRRDGYWLDVGFGNGSLLFTAEEWGYVPVGLDLRKTNVDALRTLGYEAHCLAIEALPHDGRYSVVSMADVLEHLPFPKVGLAAAHRLLCADGVLFLSMPNMDNMVWRLLHANGVNPYWGELEHYHNFSRKRLYALLEEHGFTPLSYHVGERYRVSMEVIAAKRG